MDPIEDLWHYLRSHHWSNRKYDTVDDLFAATETAWRAPQLHPQTIRTVCRTPYAETRNSFMGMVQETPPPSSKQWGPLQQCYLLDDTACSEQVRLAMASGCGNVGSAAQIPLRQL